MGEWHQRRQRWSLFISQPTRLHARSFVSRLEISTCAPLYFKTRRQGLEYLPFFSLPPSRTSRPIFFRQFSVLRNMDNNIRIGGVDSLLVVFVYTTNNATRYLCAFRCGEYQLNSDVTFLFSFLLPCARKKKHAHSQGGAHAAPAQDSGVRRPQRPREVRLDGVQRGGHPQAPGCVSGVDRQHQGDAFRAEAQGEAQRGHTARPRSGE